MKMAGVFTSSGTTDGSWAFRYDGQAGGAGQGGGRMEAKRAMQLAHQMMVGRRRLWPV